MYPILFQIGSVQVYSYGMMISLAILISAIALYRESSRAGINPDHILEVVIVASAAGLIGSRILFVVLNWEYFSTRLQDIFFARFEGLSFYGAFFGGALALLLWSRIRKANFLKIADLTAPYLAMGYAFGRIGCFLNGCCYGKATELPWALPAAMSDNLLRHPVQLYAAFGALLIFLILKLLRPLRPFIGFNLIALFGLYGALRFSTEFFRDEAVVFAGLTTAQLFSAVLFILSLIMMIVVFLAGRGSAEAAAKR